MDTSTPSRILNCVNRLRTWKHMTRNIPLLTLFMFIWWKIYAAKTPKWDEYGSYAYVLFFFRLLPLLSLPFCLMNFLGIFAYPLQLPHLNFEASVKGEDIGLLKTLDFFSLMPLNGMCVFPSAKIMDDAFDLDSVYSAVAPW